MGRERRGGSKEENQEDREEMEERRMETQRNTETVGEREGSKGYRSRDTEVGHQRGIRGREEGRQRIKCAPPLLLGLHNMGHLLCGSEEKASGGWGP